jgi:hypothetical protein
VDAVVAAAVTATVGAAVTESFLIDFMTRGKTFFCCLKVALWGEARGLAPRVVGRNVDARDNDGVVVVIIMGGANAGAGGKDEERERVLWLVVVRSDCSCG